jgi:hypothetical protein
MTRRVAYRKEWSSSSSSRRSTLEFVVILWSCFVLFIDANDVRARESDNNNNNNNNNNVKGDGQNPTDSITTTTTITTDTGSSTNSLAATLSTVLEDLWATETAAAQAELHRFLIGQYKFDAAFSMPNTPPAATIPNPKPSPQSAPAPAPPTAATFAPHTGRPTSLNGSCLTGRTEEQYLLDEMLQVTSSVNLLLDPDFAQGMAFNFILADDAVRQDVCGYPTLAQRYGLGTCLRDKRWHESVLLLLSLSLSPFRHSSLTDSPIVFVFSPGVL